MTRQLNCMAGGSFSYKVSKMRRSYKFRLWTNKTHERELSIAMETHRRLYNQCLEIRKKAWEESGQTLTKFQQSKWFTSERKKNEWYAKLNSQSARETIARLDLAFQGFFRRVKIGEKPGYPRFKAIGRMESFKYPTHGNGIRLVGNRLRVHGVGTIRVNLHREIEGEIRQLAIKREGDKWYLIVSCLIDMVPEPSKLPPVGIDLGLTHFFTTSDGERESNPRYLKKDLPMLRIISRSVSRKMRGSRRRKKAVRKLRKFHARIANLRKDHHHKVALSLVRRYGMIAVENLTVADMVRNGRFSRSISDAGWTGFVNVLRSKAESAGVQIVVVDPKGTSQNCSGCGQEVRKDITVRWHECPHCGLSMDRDHNAALNILARARLARAEPAGVNVNQ